MVSLTDTALPSLRRREPVVRVLDVDPDLGSELDESRLREARDVLRAATLQIAPGRRSGEFGIDGGCGMLVLDGLLMRTVCVEDRSGSELLGRGDLLRPWQDDEESPALSIKAHWRFITPTRVAMLDSAFTRRLAPYPEVVEALLYRGVMRSRMLAVSMAIVHQPRIDVRLRMLLWHLAGRWGRVVPGGVDITLPLTHALLAELVASRRPTVTSALGELVRAGVIDPLNGGGWRLNGDRVGAGTVSGSPNGAAALAPATGRS